MLLGRSIKNYCNNFYLHNKPFKITLKTNSYLLWIFRRGPINRLTPFFSQYQVHKNNSKIFLLFQKSQTNGCNNLYFLWWEIQITFLSDFTFRCGPVKPSTPTFRNTNLTETIRNLIVTWKLSQKQLQESPFAS